MSNSANTQPENIKNKKDVLSENVETKKDVAKIEVLDHPAFEFNFKSCFINTIEMANVIDSLFGSSMRDYIGCKICLNGGDINQSIVPVGKFYVNLYFKDRSNSNDNCPITNLVKRSDAVKGSSKFSILYSMTSANAGRTYKVTDETYEALDKFRFFPGQKTNWLNLTSEKAAPYGYVGNYNQEILVCITGIDLEKIIEEVYGRRTDDGVFEYQATPAQIVANASGEYVIQITQLDVNKLNDLRKSLGGPIMNTEFHQYVR